MLLVCLYFCILLLGEGTEIKDSAQRDVLLVYLFSPKQPSCRTKVNFI